MIFKLLLLLTAYMAVNVECRADVKAHLANKDYTSVGSKLVPHDDTYHFQGKYGGSCQKDGFYYLDQENFVICSNSNAYVQPCAPGSRNSGLHQEGQAYHYFELCDINLVDLGYGVKFGPQRAQPYSNEGLVKNYHKEAKYVNEAYDHETKVPAEEYYNTHDKYEQKSYGPQSPKLPVKDGYREPHGETYGEQQREPYESNSYKVKEDFERYHDNSHYIEPVDEYYEDYPSSSDRYNPKPEQRGKGYANQKDDYSNRKAGYESEKAGYAKKEYHYKRGESYSSYEGPHGYHQQTRQSHEGSYPGHGADYHGEDKSTMRHSDYGYKQEKHDYRPEPEHYAPDVKDEPYHGDAFGGAYQESSRQGEPHGLHSERSNKGGHKTDVYEPDTEYNNRVHKKRVGFQFYHTANKPEAYDTKDGGHHKFGIKDKKVESGYERVEGHSQGYSDKAKHYDEKQDGHQTRTTKY